MSTFRFDITWLAVVVCIFQSFKHQVFGDREENKADYCESEKFQAKCGENEAILMTSAKYGRMEIGRCITQSYGHIGCSVDVLDVLDSFCSGRHNCNIVVSHPAIITRRGLSCPKDMAGYLVASFICVKASQMDTCGAKGHITIDNNSGYISPIPQSGITSRGVCPVIIQSATGRQINITMYSFLPTPTSDQPLGSSTACYEIGTIKAKDGIHTMHKCLNDPRRKSLLVSDGGKVEVVITNQQISQTAGVFLLHYKAFGCNNPEIPAKAKVQRNGNEAKVICKDSEQSWTLVCKDETWVGEKGTCSTAGFFSEDGWSFLGLFDHSHPYGTAIVVGIGATLGVLIGGVLLYIIIAIVKRCQREEYRNYEYTDNNFTHVPVDFHGDKTDLVFNDGNNSQFGTWGPRSTLGRTDHSRMPLPPLPKDNNTLSYEKPLINRNGTEGNNIL